MKRTFAVILLQILWWSCACLAVQIESVPWEASNIAKLNKLNKASVTTFLNKVGGSEGTPAALKPADILQFKWLDLSGDGRCDLVVAVQTGPNFASVGIFWHEPNKGFTSQSLAGELSFKDGIRDLNGDGKKEIIMYSFLDDTGISAGWEGTHVWPEVYRLEGEKYVPASRDFAGFYDLEILPKLDKEIAETPALNTVAAAALEMQRDKILRVLGRDPNAGLEKARYWMKSDDPRVVWDAYLVFEDIPGHEAEANAAREAEKQASQRWVAAHPNN